MALTLHKPIVGMIINFPKWSILVDSRRVIDDTVCMTNETRQFLTLCTPMARIVETEPYRVETPDGPFHFRSLRVAYKVASSYRDSHVTIVNDMTGQILLAR